MLFAKISSSYKFLTNTFDKNNNMKQIGTILLQLTAILCISCANQSGDNQANSTTVVKQEQNTSTLQAPADVNTPAVSFKVNGVQANTFKNGSNDDDEHLGLYTVASNFLGFDLMGDDPVFPHRGWLSFGIVGFKLEPATYTLSVSPDRNAGFSRYERADAGGETMYNTAKSGKMTLTFTEIVKDNTQTIGEQYLATGTFEVTLSVSEYQQDKVKSGKAVPEIEITEGKFSRVPIRIMGRL